MPEILQKNEREKARHFFVITLKLDKRDINITISSNVWWFAFTCRKRVAIAGSTIPFLSMCITIKKRN
jgi:hypothetical protein